MDRSNKNVADAIKFYFEQNEILKPHGKVLIIHGAPGIWLNHLKTSNIDVLSYFANENDEWIRKGICPIGEPSNNYDLVIHFATKFADENQSMLGKYCQTLSSNGRWVSVIPNKMGASRFKKDITKIYADVNAFSKAKCRIFEAHCSPNRAIASKWKKLGDIKSISDTHLKTTAGIFSSERIDPGSQLLANVMQQESFYGSVADLGAGYGFLSKAVLKNSRQKIREIVLYELDKRALYCAKKNLSHFNNTHFNWSDVTQGVHHQRKFDWVIMNPPFHKAHDQNFELGKEFIRQASHILKPGGGLYLVANLHLPYEGHLQEMFRSHRLLDQADGYKCFFARC